MTVIDADTHVVEDTMIWDYIPAADAAYKPTAITPMKSPNWPIRRAVNSSG